MTVDKGRSFTMMKEGKFRRINLSIFGKIKIYKKTTVLEEKRLKKLHKIKPCFVYINPREESLCLKQMKGKRKKQYYSSAPVHQEPVRQASPFIPNPRILENKPFIKQNSLMAMKQDAFFRKYNLDRDAVMKRCLFYKEDINHFIMFLQRYFNMKEKEKIVEENQRCMERFKDVRLNQRVRVLLTPLKEASKRVKEKTKELDNGHSAKLIDITINEDSNRVKNYHYTDDGMTDADEMEVDKPLPDTSSGQNKVVHQIDIDEFFVSDGNEDEVCKMATNYKTGTNTCYTVSLATQMEHQVKLKFKDVLEDVAAEFEKFCITKKSDMKKAETAQTILESVPVSIECESNKEGQNNFDTHEETSGNEDDQIQANDVRDSISLSEIKDKQDMVVTVETGGNEGDSSFVPECSQDNSDIKSNQNDFHVSKKTSPKQASCSSVVSSTQGGADFKYVVRDSDNEYEKSGEISDNNNECEKDEPSSNSDNECEKNGELSNDSDGEDEKDAELSNDSDFESKKHDNLLEKSDLDRESVIQRCTSDFRSTASDDEPSSPGYSSGDKSKNESNESDLESEEAVTASKSDESTRINHSDEETFCGVDTNAINDSRTDRVIILAGMYKSDTGYYETTIPDDISGFSLLVSNIHGNPEG